MKSALQWCRYALFASFIITNAVICSVAVWNLSLAQSIGWNLRVDLYLIIVGALALVSIFTIMFIELATRHPVTSRVWFECAWLVLFLALELAGAVALTSIVPSMMCSLGAILLLSDSCSSTHLLMAFSWICTIMLILYLSFLVMSVLLHRNKHKDSQIWQASVRNFPWSDSRQYLATAPPTSPMKSLFRKKAPVIVAPQPRRAAPPAIYAYRSGLGSEYEIEHYRPPSPREAQPLPMAPPPALSVVNPTAISLYPQHLQPALTFQHTHTQRPSPAISQPTPRQIPRQLPPSPPPLGDWPRVDVITRPLRTKRKPLEQVSPTAGDSSSSSNSSPPRPKPSGPRTRSTSNAHRPPPLDLSNITSFNERPRN